MNEHLTQLVRDITRGDIAADTPIYVLKPDQLPPGTVRSLWAGMAGRDFDAKMYPYIDDWRGRGVGMFAEDEPTAVHETGHAILLPIPDEQRDGSDYLEMESVRNADEEAFDATTPGEFMKEGLPPWHQHAGDWIRATLHLFHRAAVIGYDVQLPLASTYHLSSALFYYTALLPELATTPIDAPLIPMFKQQPPPKKFIELWQGDVQYWLDQQTNPSTSARRLCELEMAFFNNL